MSKRILLLFAGAGALSALWFGSLPMWSLTYFTAHMILHMGVTAIAAPLLALAVAGGKYDPVRRWPAALPPLAISFAALIAIWAWHTPELHHFARTHFAARVIEQLSFFAAGFLVTLASFGGDATQRRTRAGAAIGALLATSFQFIALGALLVFTTHVRYLHEGYFRRSDSRLTPLDDQHLGGAIMLVIGGGIFLAGGLWLTRTLLRERATGSAQRTL